MNDLRCRQADLDICRCAVGQHESGCSSRAGCGPVSCLSAPLWRDWARLRLPLQTEESLWKFHAAALPISHHPFPAVFITACSVWNTLLLSRPPVLVARSQGRLLLPGYLRVAALASSTLELWPRLSTYVSNDRFLARPPVSLNQIIVLRKPEESKKKKKSLMTSLLRAKGKTGASAAHGWQGRWQFYKSLEIFIKHHKSDFHKIYIYKSDTGGPGVTLAGWLFNLALKP